MLHEIRQITNPLQRSLRAGLLSSTMVTILTGAVLSLARAPQAAYVIAVYASCLSAGGGAVAGLISGKPNSSQATADPPSGPPSGSPDPSPNHEWKEWRNFIVDRKVQESDVITSFYLKPQDQNPIPLFQPGQFLTIRLEIPGQAKPVIRTYSLSDYQDPCSYYRLSIKRESAPKGLDVPPGLASNYMHDQIKVGSVIEAKPPTGKFFLTVQESHPIVLVSNGVGITPMISMAKACTQLNPQRPIWFVHGARNSKQHAFRDEVAKLAEQNANLHVYYRYSRPDPEDGGEHQIYHSVGYVDVEFIREVIAPEIEQVSGSPEADYFLCGSPPFLDGLRSGFKEWGIPDRRVFFEVFGKPKTASSFASGSVPSEAPAAAGDASRSAEIQLARSNQSFQWQSGEGTILEFLEAKGINPPFSCRAGICLTCMSRIEAGEVEYLETPTGTPDPGSVLICISEPKTPSIMLDL